MHAVATPADLLQPIVAGTPPAQRRAIAKAITLLESTRADHRAQGDELLTALLPHTGNSLRLGISGVPGVGKSTFIESLGVHLIERGHPTLAFLHLHFPPNQMARCDGFRREVERAGRRFVELAPKTQPRTWHPAPGPAWDWLDERLQEIGTPVGILATNDQIARPLVDALCALGYRIPEDVAVVGAENDPLVCDIAAVPISSVDTRTRLIGYEAARLLDRIMCGEVVDNGVLRIAPGHVVTRDSTDALAVANPHAAYALRFIWDHYRDPIHINDIAAGIPVTRRRLQTLFQQELRRTMQDEVTRVRTAHACRLLARTSLKVNAVAQQSGLSTSLHLHRTFQNLLNTGPKAFREGGCRIPDLGVLPASAENAGA